MSNSIIRPRDFKRKPLFVKAINGLWGLSYPLGTRVSLNKDRLLKIARKRTGLHHFGQDFWEEPLDRLLIAIEEEAHLHPFGRFMVREKLLGQLCTRLKAEYWFQKHPEILDQELYPIWLIVGLQRTGTTKLQRLLGADPQARSLLSWEALNPAPTVPLIASGKADPRIKEAKQAEQALKFIAPGFFAIHPIEHQAPEEDILLLDASFLSTTPEAILNVPSYAQWLESIDQSPAYAFQVQLLKLLQWQRPGKHWILKSPHHLEFMDLAARHYGDVKFIWTHRPVEQCVPSFMSMLCHGRSMFSDAVNLQDTVEHWLRKLGYMLDKALASRKEIGEDHFHDVYYPHFIEDSLKYLQSIYARFGKVSPEITAYFREAEQTNQPHIYGRHQYHMDDFGLNPQSLEHFLGPYQTFLSNYEAKIR